MVLAKAVEFVVLVWVAAGGCSSSPAPKPTEAHREAIAESQQRADTMMWQECARTEILRLKNDVERRTLTEMGALEAAYSRIETVCPWAPFRGNQIRRQVRRLWNEL